MFFNVYNLHTASLMLCALIIGPFILEGTMLII